MAKQDHQNTLYNVIYSSTSALLLRINVHF